MDKRDYEEIRKFKNMKFMEQNKIYVEKKFRKLSYITLICGIFALILISLIIKSKNKAIGIIDVISLSLITYGIMSISKDIMKSNTNINSSKLHIEILEDTIKDLENIFSKIDSVNKENNHDE